MNVAGQNSQNIVPSEKKSRTSNCERNHCSDGTPPKNPFVNWRCHNDLTLPRHMSVKFIKADFGSRLFFKCNTDSSIFICDPRVCFSHNAYIIEINNNHFSFSLLFSNASSKFFFFRNEKNRKDAGDNRISSVTRHVASFASLLT